jgi:pyruvate ferredoxin oxidoreductase gamma subunit
VKTINERGIIDRPDLVVVADDTLLAVPAAGTLQGIDAGSVVLVNSHETADTWCLRLNLDATLLTLSAVEEVDDRAALPHIGATCAGAAACLLGIIEPEVLVAAIAEELTELGGAVVAKNCSSAMAAFEAMTPQRGLVREGAAIAVKGYTPPQWIDLPFEDASISAPDIRANANSVQVRTGLWRTLRPVIDYDHCGKCWWVCSTFCPDSAILVDNGAPVIDYDHCKGCMICVGVCPPHAIAGIPEYLAQQQEALKIDGGEPDGSDVADR